ncbi:MAG TPA: helix-turn-helix transcriptional regulator [Clostridia bacterium]|nr:helix-turn-helix transcriptional regulator [Clostridia bacterium]
MDDLRRRFGRLVAAHRRRSGLSQERLAEMAGISKDMVSKIELGVSGARFPVIERLATALKVDPAEFFTTELSSGIKSKQFADLTARLAGLSDADLRWANDILDAAFSRR